MYVILVFGTLKHVCTATIIMQTLYVCSNIVGIISRRGYQIKETV